MDNTEIVETIMDCLDGKKDSFCKIIRHFQKQIFRFCYHFVGTHQDAEDAATDIFLKVYNSLNSFNTNNQFSSWMYRIAYNHLIDLTRKKKREINYLISANPGKTEHNESANPSEIFFKNLEEKKLRKVLEALPFKYRTALMLKYYQP